MSLDPGLAQSFDLTFTQAGTFTYYCIVHGKMMSGTVVVDPDSAAIPSPSQVSLRAGIQIAQQLAKGPTLFQEARAKVPPPTRNPDGTTTYHVLAGYDSDQIALMRFFPSHLVVHPGDTVEWITGDAPHTVTFLNGGPDIPFAVFWLSPTGPTLLVNPQVLMPLNPGVPLTNTGVYSSGFLPAPGMTYSLTIGNTLGLEQYQCLLHDTSGMEGSLFVAPRD